ncbi:MAG: hypothetical protein F2813_00320 [Actinobacteria bacterium]|uniref:Unannotated protein n=1 Tax=freshwater metagenome TaxID=449393 RepID=A0A6J5YZL0_9ZZZZ|nr:hypothetical protein [Actinomycetota bacterium]
MCTFGPELLLAATLASTVIGGVATISQADASAKSSRYNAEVSMMNATLSERRAKDAEERGRREEQAKRLEVADLQGRQRAAMSANGVDLSFGSAFDTLVDTQFLGEMDALTIRRNSATEAYDHRVAAASGRADASLARSNADSALTGGYLSAASTVLGGATSGYKDYASYTRPIVGGR